jgi:hypothetical protein
VQRLVGIADQVDQPDQRFCLLAWQAARPGQQFRLANQFLIEPPAAIAARALVNRPVDEVPVPVSSRQTISGVIGIALIAADIVGPGLRLGKERLRCRCRR